MKERRKYPRIAKPLSIKLSDQEFDILTETNNISASGAYCPVNKPVDLMTKLSIVLLIPIHKNKTRTIKKISCCGVVVRCEYVTENGKYPYRIAVFFNDLKDSERKALGSYIDSSLKIY